MAVDGRRSVTSLPGVNVSRLSDFDAAAQVHLGPPLVRVEHALLTVASRSPDEATAVAVVELDGRLGHERVGDRWIDLDRDVDSAVNGDLTLRAG